MSKNVKDLLKNIGIKPNKKEAPSVPTRAVRPKGKEAPASPEKRTVAPRRAAENTVPKKSDAPINAARPAAPKKEASPVSSAKNKALSFVGGLWNIIKTFALNIWGKITAFAAKIWADIKAFLVRTDKRIFMGAALALIIIVIGGVIIGLAVTDKTPENVQVNTLTSPSDDPQSMTLGSETPPVVTPEPTPEPTPDYVAPGEESDRVPPIQQRLMDLGYMDVDEPTQYYGPMTKSAVQLFQKKNGLEADGYAGTETLALLNSDQAKPYVASVGDNDTYVQEMQIRLRELWYFNAEPTGYFGTDTEAAVKLFQEKNGLTVDGKIGSETMEMLYSEEAKANAYAYGESSEGITTYQKRLKTLGYLTTEPDGTYGPDTVTAVRRFQSENGLIADGALGRETATLLMSDNAEKSSLKVGSEGSQVENVQNRLVELKYLKKATGYFGSDTESAVRAFQKRNGLTIDGKVGPQTLSVLMSDNAKKASSSSSGSSGSSGGSSATKKPSSGGSSSGGSSANITGANVESFVSVAESKLGCKYVRGAKGPNKFDCSGFVYWCLNQVGVKQSYMTSYAWRSCTKYQKITNINDVRRGDVIIYKMGKTKGHCAIAISNDMMIDASSGNGKVVKRSFMRPWSKKAFYCAYRIF